MAVFFTPMLFSPRSVLVAFLALCAPSAFGAGAAPAADPLAGTKPNIIFIFTDDHAAQALGAYGSKFGDDVTPRLDAMARSGATFEDCVCANPLCGPSRAIVMTGKYSHGNRFFSNEYSPNFDGKQRTLPKVMAEAGYESAVIGKWHLGGRPVGFNHFEVLPGHGSYYATATDTKDGRKNSQGYVTDLLTDKAIDWMKSGRNPEKPFILMLHHKAPHRNWVPGPNELALFKGRVWPEPANLRDDYSTRSQAAVDARMRIADHMYFDNDLLMPAGNEFMAGSYKQIRASMTEEQRARFDAAYDEENAAFLKNPPKGDALLRWKYQRYMTNYLRCVAGVDRSVGRVLDYLKEAGLDENTVVVYSSDQGFFLGEHGWYDKRLPYDESVRMPLIVRWPGKIKAGQRIPALVQNTDFLPTFMDLAGLPPEPAMHGTSLLPLIAETKSALRDGAYTHFYEDTGEHHAGAYVALRTKTHKLVNYYDRGFVELYDLVKDPSEMKNVADSPAYAKVRRELEAALKATAQRYGDKTGPWGDDKGGAVPERNRVKPGSGMPKPALVVGK